jgi:hypothetical protein
MPTPTNQSELGPRSEEKTFQQKPSPATSSAPKTASTNPTNENPSFFLCFTLFLFKEAGFPIRTAWTEPRAPSIDWWID